MQLRAVNFIPLLSSLYMFQAAHTRARPHWEKVAVTICADTMVCNSGCRYS